MPIAPHIAALREKIGHDLLLVPCVAVLPRDDQGRVLLVRQSDFGLWGTVGGRSTSTSRRRTPPDVRHVRRSAPRSS